MKKALSIVLFAGLGAAIALGFNAMISADTEENEWKDQQHLESEVPVHATNYLPGPPANGPDFRTAAEMTVNAVVHIRATFERKSHVYDDFFGQLFRYFENSPQSPQYRPMMGYGSGVIIKDDGYIITNNHVVQDASEIEVVLNDKRTYTAEVIGNDPSTDLALIKINETGLPNLAYGNSDNVQVGEWVLAVGNPFNLTSTVTAGIVSAKARDINILGKNTAIEAFIQTDAAVNRGNSGGALVNTDGELVGINAAIASNTGSYEGYSFAIPVNLVQKVVDDFLEFGAIQRAYIGVVIREMNAEFAKELGMEDIRGVYVNAVSEDGGAEEAGIREGDIILSIEDIEVNSLSELLEIVGQHRPGDEIDLEIMRDGKYKNFEVELKDEYGSIELAKQEPSFHSDLLGAELRKLNNNEMNKYRIDYGLSIVKLDDNGMLRKGGVREGFIIKEINDMEIDSRDDIQVAMEKGDGMNKIEGIYPNGLGFVYVFK